VHVVIDNLPANFAQEGGQPNAPVQAAPIQNYEPAPIDSTVLVFRDGHKQQVTNYAVVGQTLYVFDERRQKIPLGDLDVPATIKVNDDRGVEFQLPGSSHS
jgi:hypothetical protein